MRVCAVEAGDYLLQLEWVETEGRQERVGGVQGQPSVLIPFFTTVPGCRDLSLQTWAG